MEGANSSVLLCLDIPEAALVGIDLLAFTSTPRFRGVKNIPPGYHFTYVGSSTAFSERHGIWFYVDNKPSNRPSLTITKWDPANDTLLLSASPTEDLHWRANLGTIWKEGLTPYRQTTTSSSTTQTDSAEWTRLTSRITTATISRITSTSSSLSSGSSAQQDLENIPGLNVSDSIPTLSFLPINLKQTWSPTATGRERTTNAQDRSWALQNLITTSFPGKSEGAAQVEILGELQFCFVMVLTLNNFSCLEQWRRLLGLLLTCKNAVGGRAGFFVDVLRVLRGQLVNCRVADTGLIDLSEEGSGFLKKVLRRFRKGVEGLGMSGVVGVQDVVDELEELEEYLGKEHGWSFGGVGAKGGGMLELEDGEEVRYDMGTLDDEEDETGEYAPQIVDLTPEMARFLNVGGAEGLHQRLDKAKLDESSDEEEADADRSEDEGDEEMQDLEDMDSRY